MIEFLLSLSIDQILLLLTFFSLIFAGSQLRWTRLETAVPEWKVVEVTRHSPRENSDEYTVNATLQNVGKGRGHTVNAELFQSNVKLDDLEDGEEKVDVIREDRRNVGGKLIVNPKDYVKINFRVKQLEKLNEVTIKVKPEDTVSGYVTISQEKIKKEYTNFWFAIKRFLDPVRIYRDIRYRLRDNSEDVM